MLTDDDLKEIESRLAFYSGEYWALDDHDPHVVRVTNRQHQPMPPMIQNNVFPRRDIAKFIAHSPDDMQNLLDEVRRLRRNIMAAHVTLDDEKF